MKEGVNKKWKRQKSPSWSDLMSGKVVFFSLKRKDEEQTLSHSDTVNAPPPPAKRTKNERQMERKEGDNSPLKALAQVGARHFFLSRRLNKIKGVHIKKQLCERGSAPVSAPPPQEPPPPAWMADSSHPNGFVRENILSLNLDWASSLSFFFPFLKSPSCEVFYSLLIHTHARSCSSEIMINLLHGAPLVLHVNHRPNSSCQPSHVHFPGGWKFTVDSRTNWVPLQTKRLKLIRWEAANSNLFLLFFLWKRYWDSLQVGAKKLWQSRV